MNTTFHSAPPCQTPGEALTRSRRSRSVEYVVWLYMRPYIMFNNAHMYVSSRHVTYVRTCLQHSTVPPLAFLRKYFPEPFTWLARSGKLCTAENARQYFQREPNSYSELFPTLRCIVSDECMYGLQYIAVPHDTLQIPFVALNPNLFVPAVIGDAILVRMIPEHVTGSQTVAVAVDMAA